MQGFNMGRYVPPDQEGVVSGNKLAGKHALGSRARNLQTTGELTVRFEMPFPIWCSTCQPAESVIIGQGVRFNALKKKIGNYYSTPIYSFRMKHSVCGGWIEIRTDPQNTEYVVAEGARRKITAEMGKGEYEETTTGTGEIRVRMPGQTGEDEAVDPFTNLEGKVADKNRYMTEKMRMEGLLKQQDRDWEDPYENSKKLRRAFRAERKRREATKSETEALKDKFSLGVDLLDETEGDRLRAGVVEFGPHGDREGSTFSLPSTLRAKPLFGTSTPPQHKRASSAKAGQLKKRKKAEDIILEKKALLQQELRGNTKAAIDPFLLTDDMVWQQSPGALKKKRPNKVTGEITPNTRDRGDNGGDFEFKGAAESSDSLVSSECNGRISDPLSRVPSHGPASQKSSRTALVDYGSESD
ncbi:hypothetical protein FQN49_008477 [Arthroderma sp. PD_2]|nr:hypothetical protein FQN49_008477 [Arthroderma sp. PD_2]